MATIYRCDVCKKIFEKDSEIKRISVPDVDYHERRLIDSQTEKDACVTCVKEVRETLKRIEGRSNVREATDS